jgi:hypothetical protein
MIKKIKLHTVITNISIALVLSTLILIPSYAKEKLPAKDETIVAYYGRPGVSSLGVLGQHSIDALIPIVKAKADEYAKILNHHVTPAFDIIYGLGAADPGRRKDYIIPLSSQKLMPYITAAKEHGFALFIDLQLGKMTPLQAVQPVLKYLKYPNVHIAIDPEFEVHDLEIPPGRVVGHISGEEINQVQEAMTQYMNKNNIQEKKILVVHMFRHSMVTDQEAVRGYKNIDLIMNLDGHGPAKLKIDIYNGLYTKNVAAKIAGGFKLFFKEDKPSIMTPREVLGLESISGVKIKSMPRYINYE